MSSMAAEPPEILRFEGGKVMDDKTHRVIDLTSPMGQEICDAATNQGMKITDFEGCFKWGCNHQPHVEEHVAEHRELVPA